MSASLVGSEMCIRDRPLDSSGKATPKLRCAYRSGRYRSLEGQTCARSKPLRAVWSSLSFGLCHPEQE
eukprot:8585686-Alexandrium_andersonii.AAC.1